MSKVSVILLSLVLSMIVGLGGCITAVNPPTETTPTTELAPAETAAAPELVSPHNGAIGVELTPRFLWKAVPGAKGYELAVSLNSDFSHRVISVSMGDTAYQSPPDLRYYQTQEYDTLTPSTRYYWMVAAKIGGGGSPVWTFTTGTAAASSPSPEPTIDEIFLSRWGHTYYNNEPRASYDLDQIEKLLIEIVCQVPWQSYYKAGVFDCSEKSAYLEYLFERHGYTAEIAEGEGHAWVLVYNDVDSCWLSIEATLPVGTLNPPHPYTPTIGGIVDCNFNLERKWEDIYHVEQISEYDWWDSPLADLLVKASDTAPASTSTLIPLPLEVPPSTSQPAPSSIDEIFLSRWGHTYYNNAPRVSFDSFDIDKLIIQTNLQIPWQLCYEPSVFDCSEMAAYLEYVLERHGYTAQICQGAILGEHAWVVVYNNVARCWIPIEATSVAGTLEPILFRILTLGMTKDHYTPRWRWEDIYDVRTISEYDWWNSPYADQLVVASDRAKLSEPLPPLPEIKYPDLPPLPDWPLPY